MTKAQLFEKLKEYPDDMPVIINDIDKLDSIGIFIGLVESTGMISNRIDYKMYRVKARLSSDNWDEIQPDKSEYKAIVLYSQLDIMP